jgi:chitinase
MADITPPRNVIYFSDGTYPLTDIVNLTYTDVVVAFLVPDSNFNLVGAGGAFDDNLQSNIQALQQAGKNVLISFGGATFPAWPTQSAAYQYYVQNRASLVNQIVDNFVKQYGFNGVDIDYEDDAGFTGTYNGIDFLSALTSDLAQALPSGQNIITHAPQIPYWDSNYYSAPYAQIWQRVSNQITWINNQFYNQPGYDTTAADKVNWYQKIVAITGPQKSLLGATLDPNTEGYITLDDMIINVITPLKATFGTAFGGAMGWEFYYDMADQAGIWGSTIASALGSPVLLSGSWHTNDLDGGDKRADRGW